MAAKEMKSRLVSDLDALELELNSKDTEDSDIPTLQADSIPVLSAKEATKSTPLASDTLKQLDSELAKLEQMMPNDVANQDDIEAIDKIIDEHEDTAESQEPETADSSEIDTTPEAAESDSELDKPTIPDLSDDITESSFSQSSLEPLPIDSPPAPNHAAPGIDAAQHRKATSNKNIVDAAADENPFLPKHLQDRLSRSKNDLMEEIAKSTDALNASSQLLRKHAGEENNATKTPSHHDHQSTHAQLIDALIAQYLPIIEADLRRRLHASLSADAPPPAGEK